MVGVEKEIGDASHLQMTWLSFAVQRSSLRGFDVFLFVLRQCQDL